jgi:hypothetical protein
MAGVVSKVNGRVGRARRKSAVVRRKVVRRPAFAGTCTSPVPVPVLHQQIVAMKLA